MHICKWFRDCWRAKAQRVGSLLMSAVFAFPCIPVYPALLAMSPSAAAAPTHGKVAMAYAYDAKAPKLADRDAKYLTHIIWSFGLIVEGKVSTAHWKNIDSLQKYKKKHPHIKTLMAIGGWAADGFSQAAATGEGRAAFVASAMEQAERYGFDGIDIDWEYPGKTTGGITASLGDRENFTLLVRDLRKAQRSLTAQDGRTRILSIAVGASSDCAQGIDCAAVAQYVDYVNIMSYDLKSGSKVTGHHTSMFPSGTDDPSAHGAVEAFERAGMPRKKLVIGAAFYGHMWKNVTSVENNGMNQTAGDRGATTIGYSNIMRNYYGQNGYEIYWDDGACAPYMFNGTNFITFDNPNSVRIKAMYARERGLAGIMFWEYSHDPTGELLQAIDSGLRK